MPSALLVSCRSYCLACQKRKKAFVMHFIAPLKRLSNCTRSQMSPAEKHGDWSPLLVPVTVMLFVVTETLQLFFLISISVSY